VAGLALLLGIDRFMSEARAITNLIGNGVATIVIARVEGALDIQQARAVLARDPVAMADEPELVSDSAASIGTQVTLQF
jgi:aerobic C4-dicarboxylate transport protein